MSSQTPAPSADRCVPAGRRLFIVLALAVQWTGGEACGQGPIIMPEANQEGAFFFYLLLGGFLTLVLGRLALVLFRRAVRKNMEGAQAADPPVPASGSRRAA